MQQSNKNAIKTNGYHKITITDSQVLTTLHQETGCLDTKIKLSASAANDTLYNQLEARYGSAFAQGIIDSMSVVVAKEKA